MTRNEIVDSSARDQEQQQQKNEGQEDADYSAEQQQGQQQHNPMSLEATAAVTPPYRTVEQKYNLLEALFEQRRCEPWYPPHVGAEWFLDFKGLNHFLEAQALYYGRAVRVHKRYPTTATEKSTTIATSATTALTTRTTATPNNATTPNTTNPASSFVNEIACRNPNCQFRLITKEEQFHTKKRRNHVRYSSSTKTSPTNPQNHNQFDFGSSNQHETTIFQQIVTSFVPHSCSVKDHESYDLVSKDFLTSFMNHLAWRNPTLLTALCAARSSHNRLVQDYLLQDYGLDFSSCLRYSSLCDTIHTIRRTMFTFLRLVKQNLLLQQKQQQKNKLDLCPLFHSSEATTGKPSSKSQESDTTLTNSSSSDSSMLSSSWTPHRDQPCGAAAVPSVPSSALVSSPYAPVSPDGNYRHDSDHHTQNDSAFNEKKQKAKAEGGKISHLLDHDKSTSTMENGTSKQSLSTSTIYPQSLAFATNHRNNKSRRGRTHHVIFQDETKTYRSRLSRPEDGGMELDAGGNESQESSEAVRLQSNKSILQAESCEKTSTDQNKKRKADALTDSGLSSEPEVELMETNRRRKSHRIKAKEIDTLIEKRLPTIKRLRIQFDSIFFESVIGYGDKFIPHWEYPVPPVEQSGEITAYLLWRAERQKSLAQRLSNGAVSLETLKVCFEDTVFQSVDGDDGYFTAVREYGPCFREETTAQKISGPYNKLLEGYENKVKRGHCLPVKFGKNFSIAAIESRLDSIKGRSDPISKLAVDPDVVAESRLFKRSLQALRQMEDQEKLDRQEEKEEDEELLRRLKLKGTYKKFLADRKEIEKFAEKPILFDTSSECRPFMKKGLPKAPSAQLESVEVFSAKKPRRELFPGFRKVVQSDFHPYRPGNTEALAANSVLALAEMKHSFAFIQSTEEEIEDATGRRE